MVITLLLIWCTCTGINLHVSFIVISYCMFCKIQVNCSDEEQTLFCPNWQLSLELSSIVYLWEFDRHSTLLVSSLF